MVVDKADMIGPIINEELKLITQKAFLNAVKHL